MEYRSKKAFVLFGIAMISVPYSIGMYYGNLLSYVYSYRYSILPSGPGDVDPVWLLDIYLIMFTFGNLAEALIQRSMGLRLTMAVGILLFVSGLTLTYFTIQMSVLASLVTYSILGGLGNGVIQAISLFYIAGWFDDNVGIATSTTSAAAGLGGNVMNLILTSYINPDNVSTDRNKGKIAFFSQSSIVNRIPSAFIVIGCVTAVFQIFGFLFLRKPPTNQEKENSKDEYDEPKLYGSHSHTSTTTVDVQSCNGTNSHADERNLTLTLTPIHPTTEEDVKPQDVLKLEHFYIVFLCAFSLAIGQIIVATYYKLFGQLFIPDDSFLAGLGSSLSVAAIFARFACGILADRVGPKNTIIVYLSISSVFQFTWFFTPMVSKWLFFVWTDIVFAVSNSQFTLFQIVVVKLFGRKYCTSNLFLVNVALMSAMFIAPPVMNTLLNYFGWFWLFFFGGCLSMCSVLTTAIRM